MPPASWEYQWSAEHRRYYFLDKVNGISCWTKPPNCNLELPTRPPGSIEKTEAPPKPRDLPLDWEAALDVKENRYYFFRRSNPAERTWYKPDHVTRGGYVAAAADSDDEIDDETDTVRPRLRPEEQWVKRTEASEANFRYPQQRKKLHEPDLSLEVSMLHAETKVSKQQQLMRDILKDVAIFNRDYVAKHKNIHVHLAFKVSYEYTVKPALTSGELTSSDRIPEITFSSLSLATAAQHFQAQDYKRKCCIVNCANGQNPPGDISEGCVASEVDLLCQMAGLKQSLCTSSEKDGRLYPFGAAACTANNMAQFGDVLYLHDCNKIRESIEKNFKLCTHNFTTSFPVLSAAPPRADTKVAISRELIEQTVTSMFVTPLLQDPQSTTLIIGAWGCGHEWATDSTMIADVFAEFLQGKKVGNIIPAWLWAEVHFCFPRSVVSQILSMTEAGHRPPDFEDGNQHLMTFRRVFDDYKLNQTEL
eukprot:TRINITY_DN36044_c0_g1_i1.p1 TRINITY_DN36044_c0_g1~~TRINITY_DN36044_c0_g1_i1.p1  ORF type:complete len:491 (+),score=80.11 TRINITY_DN36044_c0_g1_i1:48-1475(+)